MLKPRVWTSAMFRIAIIAVMVSVGIMPGMVRAATVHAHDYHGTHEHQHALLGEPLDAAGHHPGDIDDDRDQPSQSRSDVTVIEVRVVEEAVTLESATVATAHLVAPLLLIAFVDCENIRPPSPRLWRDTSSGTGQSRVCRIVQTSHALLL